MTSSKINSIEAVMLVLSVMVSHTILSLPRDLLVLTKSSTIINLIYIAVITVLISYLIYKLLKSFPGADILDVSEFLGGKLFKNIVGTIFITHFIVSSSILLRNFCETLKIVYYPITNIIPIILLFIITMCIANRFSFNATLKTNTLILPFVFISIIFLSFANINKFIPQCIFPILGDGIFNTFVLGLTNIYTFNGIALLYFLPPILKKPEQTKKIYIISIIVSAVYLIFCVAILLFMFSFFIDTNEISPLYNATRYIEIGNFFQRFESLFLLVWILAFACYLSIVSKFSMRIFQKITNIENPNSLIDIFGLLIFAISIIPKNYTISENFQTLIYPILVIGITFFMGIIILILANIQKYKQNRLRKEKSNA